MRPTLTSFWSAQIRRKAIITMRPQAKAAKDCPSFGISTSGLARGGPACFAPQEAHSEELISRLSPQQGQIIESHRDFLFIVRVYEIQSNGRSQIPYFIFCMRYGIWNRKYAKQGHGPGADFSPPFFLEIYSLRPRSGTDRRRTLALGSRAGCDRACGRKSSKK